MTGIVEGLNLSFFTSNRAGLLSKGAYYLMHFPSKKYILPSAAFCLLFVLLSPKPSTAVLLIAPLQFWFRLLWWVQSSLFQDKILVNRIWGAMRVLLTLEIGSLVIKMKGQDNKERIPLARLIEPAQARKYTLVELVSPTRLVKSPFSFT